VYAAAVPSQPAGPRPALLGAAADCGRVRAPHLPFARIFGFVPLPAALVWALAAITCLYVVAAEITKRWFYRNGR